MRSCSQEINVLLFYPNHTHKLDRNFLWITNGGLILTRLYLFKSQLLGLLAQKANYQKIPSCCCHLETDTEDGLVWFQGVSQATAARQARRGPLEKAGCYWPCGHWGYEKALVLRTLEWTPLPEGPRRTTLEEGRPSWNPELFRISGVGRERSGQETNVRDGYQKCQRVTHSSQIPDPESAHRFVGCSLSSTRHQK